MDKTAAEESTKIIDAEPGEPFSVTLWEDRTGGFIWTPHYDPDELDLLDDDYERMVQTDTRDYGKHTFRFLAKPPGEHRLVLEALGGWNATPNNRKVYSVRVTRRSGP